MAVPKYPFPVVGGWERQALFGIAKLNVPRSDVPAVTHVDYSGKNSNYASRKGPDIL